MADELYHIPEAPEYDLSIRRIQNDDPVNAEEVLNPILEKLLENLAALKNEIQNAITVLNTKVDKIDGKDLSANDFTSELKQKLEASLTGVSWDEVEGKPEVALKSDLVSLYKYKGSVSTYGALPRTNLTAGDVYNVEDTEMNYAWTGTKWDQLGSSAIEIAAITNSEIDTIVG